MTYKLPSTDHTGFTPETILRKTDGVQIPKDEENTDWQQYLAWVAEGNTPEEAD